MSSRLTISRAGHSYAIDGQRVPSVTTIIGNATAKPALKWWAAREAAAWAATHRDLFDVLGEREWVDQAARAHDRTSRDKMARGTVVHGDARRLVAGEPVDVPDDRRAITEQAAKWLDAWDAHEIAAERPCFNVEHRYGGTFDVIARLRDGATWLLDWKTGSGPYTEQALQLAAYAACEAYQAESGDDVPMPHVDRMGFVMLSDSGADLVPVVADPARLFAVFSRMVGVSNFVEWSTPNKAGHAAWPVLGEPMPAASA